MATSRLTFLSLLMVCLARSANCTEFISDAAWRSIFYLHKYSRDVLPQTSLDDPVNVSVSLTLINIRDVDFLAKEVEIDAWLMLRWNSGLRFDPSDFQGIESINVEASRLWRPDLEIYFGDMRFTNNALAVLSLDGSVLWVPKVRMQIPCDVNQFDAKLFSEVTCKIKLGSWTYNENSISLNDNPTVDTSDYSPFSSFELMNTTAVKNLVHYQCCEEGYGNIDFVFSFKKKNVL